MLDNNTANIHKRITLPEDIGPHSLTDMEWWYCYGFLNGDQGGKYALVTAFYQAGELPIRKGHYLIFSLIDLKKFNSQSFSFIDKKLAENFLGINIPIYLLQCPHDKKVWGFFTSLIMGKLPSPHQWLSHASIQKNPTTLLYDDSSMVFKNDKNGHFEVNAAGGEIEANLEFSPVKPVSLIGENGKPNQLYYYSFTRNKIKGYIIKGEKSECVTGEGWFDHQWGYLGDLLTKTGWNWFGLQLEDGRELLINEFFSIKYGDTFSPMANLIETDGKLIFTRNLTFQPLSYWQSPLTKAVYPLKWDIIIPEFNMRINVSAVFKEQEMPVIPPLNAIWEGTCSVTVTQTSSNLKNLHIKGKGFLELVGYANYRC